MHAYLVVGEDVVGRVDQLIGKLGAKRNDFEIKKIDQVRELGKFTNLALNDKTAVVLANFDGASEVAQNAFLKELEEPQENLIYILTARSADSLLPTIVSRCQVVETQNSVSEGENRQSKPQGQTTKFLEGTVGERLTVTSKISDRGQAIEFVEALMMSGNEHVLEEAGKCLIALKANGNVQLQLTNMVVQSSQ